MKKRDYIYIYIKVLSKILSSTEKVTSNAGGAVLTLQHRNLKDSDTSTVFLLFQHVWPKALKTVQNFWFPLKAQGDPACKTREQ